MSDGQRVQKKQETLAQPLTQNDADRQTGSIVPREAVDSELLSEHSFAAHKTS